VGGIGDKVLLLDPRVVAFSGVYGVFGVEVGLSTISVLVSRNPQSELTSVLLTGSARGQRELYPRAKGSCADPHLHWFETRCQHLYHLTASIRTLNNIPIYIVDCSERSTLQ